MIRLLGSLFIIFVSAFLQTSVFSGMTYVEVTPNIMLILTVSFAILRGREEGLLTGLLSGLLLDFLSGGLIGFYGLFYMYIGFACGFLCQHINEDFPLIPIGLTVLAELFYHFYIFVFRFLLRGRLGLGIYFQNIIMPELVVTVVFSIFVYGILLFLNNKMEEREKRSALKFA